MNTRKSIVGTLLLVLALCAVAATAIIMFGARFGLWEPIVGFGYFRQFVTPMGYATAGLSLAGLIFLLVRGRRSDTVKAGVALLLGLLLMVPTLQNFVNPPVPLPPIHDISTDTVNPPQFLVLDDSREGARNTLVYGGAEVAAQQQAAYPDIAPIESELSAAAAFERAMTVGDSMGWDIVSEDASNLRFEATARTPVFHFADDVVVVVSPQGEGSRVDIRSVSRIGRGDRGVNAARIRAFISAF